MTGGDQMTVSHDDLREIRQQIAALSSRFEDGQRHIHDRLDKIARSLSGIERLDERTQSLCGAIERHEAEIDAHRREVAELRDRQAWASRLGAGGAAAGGGGLVVAILKALTS